MDNSQEEGLDFLWQSFLNGDDKSFSIIYQCYIDRLLSYGYKLHSDKEIVHDCIQEIFIDLFLKRKKTGINIQNLKAYLFVALRNNIIKKVTKRRKFELLDVKDNMTFDIEYSSQDRLIDQEISDELNQKLNAAINALPPKQKEIIYLKFEEELNYNEISEILNISVESARKLLYRALLSLRKKIHHKVSAILFHIFFEKNNF